MLTSHCSAGAWRAWSSAACVCGKFADAPANHLERKVKEKFKAGAEWEEKALNGDV